MLVEDTQGHSFTTNQTLARAIENLIQERALKKEKGE
jgi:hypothetical protein